MESFLRRAVLRSRIVVGMVALAGLFLSGLVHLASVLSVDIESTWPSVWVLHYALFPIVILAVLTAVLVPGQKPLNFRAFLTLVAAPALIVLAAAFLYVLATFLVLTPLSGSGDPVMVDGGYFFNDHGVMREVSEEQFHFQRSVSLRLFSAVWIYLYLFSVIYLLAARRHWDNVHDLRSR